MFLTPIKVNSEFYEKLIAENWCFEIRQPSLLGCCLLGKESNCYKFILFKQFHSREISSKEAKTMGMD